MSRRKLVYVASLNYTKLVFVAVMCWKKLIIGFWDKAEVVTRRGDPWSKHRNLYIGEYVPVAQKPSVAATNGWRSSRPPGQWGHPFSSGEWRDLFWRSQLLSRLHSMVLYGEGGGDSHVAGRCIGYDNTRPLSKQREWCSQNRDRWYGWSTLGGDGGQWKGQEQVDQGGWNVLHHGGHWSCQGVTLHHLQSYYCLGK